MITYKSRRTGETVTFGGRVAALSSTPSRGWQWDVSALNGSSRYSRTAREFDVSASFVNASYDFANRFFALIDGDTEAGIEGVLEFQGWEIRGNFAAGSNDFLGAGCSSYTLTFHSDWPVWRKEVGRLSFPVSSGSPSGGLDYPHDYPHDYGPPPSGQRTIDVDALRPSDFELIVYGPATNPSVTIAGIRHEVNCEVPSGSLLFVNSLNAKRGEVGAAIFTRASDGTTKNQYGSQSREFDVFAPVQPGSNLVTWSGLFGFDLILYETRTVRPWT